jgi:hypothetical protein
MLTDWYARWMYAWETRLTTRDENRVVRPLEWGFEWIVPFLEAHGFHSRVPGPEVERDAAPPKPRWCASTVPHPHSVANLSSATSARRISGWRSAFRNSSHQRAPGNAGQRCGNQAQAAEGKLLARSISALLRRSARRIPKTIW